MHGHAHTDDAAKHGMLLFGEESAYLSHFPMFRPHRPHDYQAIFDVTLSKEGTDQLAAYVEDRRAHPQTKVYSWVPAKAFVLKDLVSPDPHHPHGGSVVGSIVRGHFERDGSRTILTDVETNATNAVHFRQFDPDAEGLTQLEYILFGKAPELFLAHLITKPPDFDQILSVRVRGNEFTDEELRHGVSVVVPERANSFSERIREGEQVPAKAQLAEQDASRAIEIQVEANIEYYFEEGELGVPPTFAPTEEEIAAGMPQ
jgi:hypothetical protein